MLVGPILHEWGVKSPAVDLNISLSKTQTSLAAEAKG